MTGIVVLTPDPSASAPEAAPRRLPGVPWVPGQPSPNPSGRPKKTEPERQAEALAKEKAPQAMRKLVTMIESPRTTEAGRLRAIELLLDRALGKPTQRTDAYPEGITINVVSTLCGPPPKATPGVLNSPISEHLQVTQGLRLVAPAETIEASS